MALSYYCGNWVDYLTVDFKSYYCCNNEEGYLTRDFYYYTVEVKLYFTVWYYGLKGYKFSI